MSRYAVVWIITILGITLLGEASRQAGEEISGGRGVPWLVLLFMVMAFLGGIVGGLIVFAL